MCRQEGMTPLIDDAPDMASLRISDPPRLSTLPTDVLLIIFAHLDTARSFAHLAATCRGMNILVNASGWRIFVSTCFASLSLPTSDSVQDWRELAHVLTAQSRDWDRRAFVFSSLAPPSDHHRPHGRRGHGHHQTIPRNIIVDAHLRTRGNIREELLVWGAGEDVLARIRRSDKTTVLSESWHSYSGANLGFIAGRDDTTAVSILKTDDNDGDHTAVVGRANGDLRLLSMNDASFGRTVMRLRPSSSQSPPQRNICAVDFDKESRNLVAGTREDVFFYSIPDEPSSQLEAGGDIPSAEPIHSISLKNAPQIAPFDFIRSVKSVNKNTVAVSLNRGFDPIQVLTTTPTGVEVTAAAKTTCPHLLIDHNPRTVRALLPVDMSSAASGGGNVVLSTWDDGTIRLQDLRTPSPADRTYQDNFEVATPINALISFGLERFVAGSAYSHLLKIFDYRWDKGYYHTDSLPCSEGYPYPAPKPPTVVEEPQWTDSRPTCNHVLGRLCRWHALSRHDFYRPNCNIYLPFRHYDSSPIYTLAKPSDTSPAIYAGLSGLLVEITLRSGMSNASVPDTNPFYVRQRGKVAILETGDGSAIHDVSKSQRVPEIRRQSFTNYRYKPNMEMRWHRLDGALVNPHEWQDAEA